MARVWHRPGAAERALSWLVLGVLAVTVGWLLVRQGQCNPAVVVALSHPPVPGTMARTGAASPAMAWLPRLEGYPPAGAAESYDPQTLSDKIDGKAELYLASNFRSLACRPYFAGGPDGPRLEVFVYEMATPADAFAVFSGQRRPGAADSSLASHAYQTENALYWAQGPVYGEIVADRAGPQVDQALPALAAAVLAALPKPQGATATAVDPASLFPKTGLVGESLRLTVSDAFGLEGLAQVYTADYRLPQGEATAFVAQRASPEAANQDARRYADFLLAHGYAVQPAPGLPPGGQLLTAPGSAEVIFCQGAVLAGVHDAVSPAAAVALAAQLQAALGGSP